MAAILELHRVEEVVHPVNNDRNNGICLETDSDLLKMEVNMEAEQPTSTHVLTKSEDRMVPMLLNCRSTLTPSRLQNFTIGT